MLSLISFFKGPVGMAVLGSLVPCNTALGTRIPREVQGTAFSIIQGMLMGVQGLTALTAIIAGVKDARTVESWTRPDAKIPDLVNRRLQVAYAATLTLNQRYDRDAVAAWFTWLAEVLDDRSPASILAKTA